MSAAPRDPIIVVGCGIGGASTALALARKGVRVRVLERAPELGEVGAGLQVGPNGMRILKELGVLELLEQATVLPDRAVMFDLRTGVEVISIGFGIEFRARYGAPYAVMHRGDLHSGLLKACAQTGLVTIEPDREVVAVTDHGDRVDVRCANGSLYTAEGVIGADGIRSRVRGELLGESSLLASQYVIYRGTFPRIPEVENAVTLHAAAQHHVMHYPIRGGEMVNVVCSFKCQEDAPGGPNWGTVEQLRTAFSDANDHVKTVIANLDTEHRWVQFDREPESGWAQGRVVLTGDAAHPMHQYLAQGACQAMEDAVALSELVAAAGQDLEGAFADFESVRYARTSTVQRAARFWGELSHVGGPEAERRDRTLRDLQPDIYEDLDWLYSPLPGVPLPVVPPHHDLYQPADVDRVLA